MWTSATDAEDKTDLILSDFFFSQVLRGEQDAIVPQNHLDFLSDRPDNDTWNAIRAKTLLEYGQFADALILAQKQDRIFAAIQTASRPSLQWRSKKRCKKGAMLGLTVPKAGFTQLPLRLQNRPMMFIKSIGSPFRKDQPIFIEWALVNGHWSDTWTEIALQHSEDTHWRCANLALATQTQRHRITRRKVSFGGEDGSEWWFFVR